MDDHSEDIRRLLAIIEVYKERKYLQQERLARLGISADPSLEMDIKEIERQIAKLEGQIKSFREDRSKDVYALSVKTKVYSRRISLFPKLVSDLNLMIIAIENVKWLFEMDELRKDILEDSDLEKLKEVLTQVEKANDQFIRRYRSNSIFVPSDIDEVITSIVVKFSEFNVKVRMEKQSLRYIAIETHDHCKNMFSEVVGRMRKYIEEGK